MDDSYLVTVVIPTWNRAQLVEEAIASVVEQTYANWELIVVDDGSSDDTAGRLRRRSHSKLRVMQTTHLGHIGRLRNLGAHAGTGAFIAFLDSDDLWRPKKLETQLRAMTKDARAGWSYTEYSLFGQDESEIPLRSGQAPAISGDVLRALLEQETGVCPCTLLVRRAFFEQIGGFSEDQRLAVRDDMDIALRMARASPAIAIAERLTRVREHEGRLTNTLSSAYEHSAAAYELFLNSETDRELRRLARRRWADCLWNAGAERLLDGEFGYAGTLLWKFLINRAFSIRCGARQADRQGKPLEWQKNPC